MLILGEKYTFTSLEKERLLEKFSTIKQILYKNKEPQDVIDQLQKALEEHKFQIIVLNTESSVDNKLIKYLTNLKYQQATRKIPIVTIEHFLEKHLYKCYIPDDHDELDFLENIKGYSFSQKIQKKFVDMLAIVVLLPMLFMFKQITKRKIQQESPGSIYFKQMRVGLNNKEFECIKFRSMHIDAEKYGVQFASKNDPRVFPWGATMRKMRIDEIPQVINILKGEMHFVGPRPERRFWIEKEFEKNIPYYNQRHVVAPGITGWAQVMYPYGSSMEDAKQKLMYDLYYIKNWNIFLEFKIIYRTILVVLGQKGV